MHIPAHARLYLRPVYFADTPVGRDGEVARLAGGLQWFAACELIAVADGARVETRVVPVADLPRVAQALDRAEEVAALFDRITAPRAPLHLGARTLRLDQPHVMAILNVTPDSFSDGGRNAGAPDRAAGVGVEYAAMGASIVDVGGESTRPGAKTVWEGEEIARVVPVIERLATSGTAISIDTRKADVMAAALAAGAHIVNDVAALAWDDRALDIVSRAGCPVVLMHSADPRKGAEGMGGYADPLIEVYDWLERRVAQVVAAGVDRSRILIDPGIGFGKSLPDNLALMNGLALFHGIGCPVLLGASRKRVVGALSNEAPADKRLGGSVAFALKAAEQGAQLVRVHDVYDTVQALRIWRGMRDAALVARQG